MTINVLITILTSSNCELLEVSFKSVIKAIEIYTINYSNNINYNNDLIIFTPIIIVNSKDSLYYNTVITYFKNVYNNLNLLVPIEIIETKSNGRPGKGHNSEINYFRSHSNYDWYFPLDGDDILYPYAFWQLSEFILNNTINTTTINTTNNTNNIFKNIDILFHTGLDKVIYTPQLSCTLITKGVYIKTIENINAYKEFYNYYKNPFESKITEIGVPGRICLLNRRAANIIDPLIEWDEDAYMLDDYNPFLAAFMHSLNNNLNIAIHCNRYIYIYNMLNETNATSTFTDTYNKNNNHLMIEENRFHKSIEKYNFVKNKWHMIQDITYIKLPEHSNFKNLLTYKNGYIIETLIHYYFTTHIKELEILYKYSKWNEYITHSKLLLQRYPELLISRQKLWFRMNLGVAYLKNTPPNIAIARAEWNLALKDSIYDLDNNDLKKIITDNLVLSSTDISDAVSIISI